MNCEYCGHGLHKTCYRLTPGLVLKLSEVDDPEPTRFQEFKDTKIYPKIEHSGLCQGCGKTWHAWVVQAATPLQRLIMEHPAIHEICIPGAIYAMVVAFLYGLSLIHI